MLASARSHAASAVFATLLLCTSVLGGTPVGAATSTPSKLAGSGPIDRPTAHTNGWTFREWSVSICAGAPLDSFVADGDSAVVRWTVLNRKDGYTPPTFALDNVVVLERSVYEAQLREMGAALVLHYSSAVNPATQALDFAPLLPGGVVYHTGFGQSLGPEWSYDPQQVFWEDAFQHPDPLVGGALFDDPFDPVYQSGEPYSSSGEMRIGTGVGPEYVTVDLQLSGLTPGVEYVVSYWSRSVYMGTTDPCAAPNAEWQLEVFGEQWDCAPDLAVYRVAGARTLDWDAESRIWRVQFEVRNETGGAAPSGPGIEATFEATALGTEATVLTPSTTLPDLAPGESGWTGPIEVTLSSRVPPATVDFAVLVDYTDDCGNPATSSDRASVAGPNSSPTSAPADPRGLRLSARPNPFNPRTTLHLVVARADELLVELYDLKGRRVRTLHDGPSAAGARTLLWNGEDDDGRSLASGVYLAVARTGDEVARHKIALVR